MGKLIVIEGLDSSGKQTQTELLVKALQEKNIDDLKKFLYQGLCHRWYRNSK